LADCRSANKVERNSKDNSKEFLRLTRAFAIDDLWKKYLTNNCLVECELAEENQLVDIR